MTTVEAVLDETEMPNDNPKLPSIGGSSLMTETDELSDKESDRRSSKASSKKSTVVVQRAKRGKRRGRWGEGRGVAKSTPRKQPNVAPGRTVVPKSRDAEFRRKLKLFNGTATFDIEDIGSKLIRRSNGTYKIREPSDAARDMSEADESNSDSEDVPLGQKLQTGRRTVVSAKKMAHGYRSTSHNCGFRNRNNRDLNSTKDKDADFTRKLKLFNNNAYIYVDDHTLGNDESYELIPMTEGTYKVPNYKARSKRI